MNTCCKLKHKQINNTSKIIELQNLIKHQTILYSLLPTLLLLILWHTFLYPNPLSALYFLVPRQQKAEPANPTTKLSPIKQYYSKKHPRIPLKQHLNIQ